MDCTWNYVGAGSDVKAEAGTRVNYSYVFGNGPAAKRHDPHVTTQVTPREVGLLELSLLLRDRSNPEQAA